MIASFLQDDLIEELKRIFKDFVLINKSGEKSALKVYPQVIAIPQSKNQKDLPIEQLENGLADDKTEDEPFPYILVRISDGEIADESSAQTVNTILIIGVYEESHDNSGHKDVMNIIQKIYERFAKKPNLANKYTLLYPIEWTLQDEESYPYFFGGMSLKWETAKIIREDRFA